MNILQLQTEYQFPSRIVFPAKDQIRSRKVISRSNFGHVYKFPSIKCGRILHLEYGNEYNLANIYEFDHNVVYFQEQPFKLEYADDGKVVICYPDFLVYFDDGRMAVVEVKDETEANKTEVKAKFEKEKIALEQHGFEFSVVTNVEIKSGLRLKNSFKLKQFRRDPVSAVIREQVINVLKNTELSGRNLLKYVNGLTHNMLLSLQSHSIIYTDLSFPLNQQSMYSASKRNSQMTRHQLRVFERRCL